MKLMPILFMLLTAMPLFGRQTSPVPDPAQKLGHWVSEEQGLPAFSYTGKLPAFNPRECI